MSTTTMQLHEAGWRHRLRNSLLLANVAVLAVAGVRFHSVVHVWGAAWMIVSGTALTACFIDSLRRVDFTTRLIVTSSIMALTIAAILHGL
jgi:hypothetical protein